LGIESIPKPVRSLGWVSFFADVSSEMIYPFISIFVVGLLGAPAAVLGMTEGLAEGLVSFLKGWSGWHSDRTGKRLPYVRWGYGLAALAKPLMGFASAWPLVTLARGLDRFGKGIRGSARDALISDVVDSSNSGKAFGYHRMMDTSGALVGVLLGYALLHVTHDQIRPLLFVAGVPGGCAVLITLLLRETPRKQEVTSHQTVPAFHASPQYKRALLVMTLFALANSSDTFIPARA
jgi:MFS family permease